MNTNKINIKNNQTITSCCSVIIQNMDTNLEISERKWSAEKVCTKKVVLTESLSQLTYNHRDIKPSSIKKPNIYLGIGLWSLQDKLSTGLPIDVMQMLMSGTLLRSLIIEENPNLEPKLIILIADSMAIAEGATPEAVQLITERYIKSLNELLTLLNSVKCSEIVLSSALTASKEYQSTLELIENSSKVQELKQNDPSHSRYITTQTAITHHLHTNKAVGVKIGWITEASDKQRRIGTAPTTWDELRFDQLCAQICSDSTIQCLYTRAGLKQTKNGKQTSVIEGCPYTAYPLDNRYVIQLEKTVDIKDISPVTKRVAQQWPWISSDLCAALSSPEVGVLNTNILPQGYKKNLNNNIANIYTVLNYWVNRALQNQ